MSLFTRQVLAASGIVAVLLAWWYPTPLVLRLELVDWGQLYESRYAPKDSGPGVMGMGQAFVRSTTEPMPLNRFIDSRLADRLVMGEDPAWALVVDDLEPLLFAGNKAVRYVLPEMEPFLGLPQTDPYTSRAVQWKDERGLHHLDYRFLPAAEFAEHTLPEEIRYPLRHLWLVACAMLLFFFGFVLKGKPNLIETGSAGKGLRWSAIVFVLCGGAILWPFVYQTVGSGFSFASIFMGAVFLSGALVGLWLFGRQSAMLRRMLAGERLAHFTYTPQEWSRFVEWNYGEELSAKKGLWWVIFIVALLIGLGFVAVMRDAASLWVFGFLMALMLLLGLLALGLPKLTYHRQLKQPGQVIIGQEGIYLNGTVHSWHTWGSRLEKVLFKTKPLPHLEVIYSYLMVLPRSLYAFRQAVAVRVPVPSGQEETGRKLAAQFLVGERSSRSS